jgi:hypothetical protein
VLYRETHTLLDEIAEATIDGTRKEHMEHLATVPLLIIDDLGMRKIPTTAAEELLEIVMRRYEWPARCSLPTALWRTGANCSVTVPPSPPCWTASYITATSSNAAHGAGEQKRTCPNRRN